MMVVHALSARLRPVESTRYIRDWVRLNMLILDMCACESGQREENIGLACVLGWSYDVE